jgi:hypothetical protein
MAWKQRRSIGFWTELDGWIPSAFCHWSHSTGSSLHCSLHVKTGIRKLGGLLTSSNAWCRNTHALAVAFCTHHETSHEEWAAIGPLALDTGCLALEALRPQQRPAAAVASPSPINTTSLLQPTVQQHHPQLGWPSQQGIHEEKRCEQQPRGSSAQMRCTASSAQQIK